MIMAIRHILILGGGFGPEMNRMKRSLAGLVLWLACFALAALPGCRAKEAPNTGFTTADLMDHDPTLPFHKGWLKPGFDYRDYKKLYVADVNTDYMLKQTNWQKGERKAQIQRDVKELAVYAKQSIEKAFREDPKHLYQVLDAPTADPDALVFEMAITEIVPSKVVLNVLEYAPFWVGTGISAVRAVARDQSSTAFEARLRVASTHEIVAMSADRQVQQFAPVSVRGLTWYSHVKAILDLWSKKFVEAANRKPGERVKAIDTFTLRPW
jgi:hypothetical protein